MMSGLFQREPEGFWQAAPRERPLWALVVALAMLALFVAVLCVLAVGAQAEEATYRCVDQTPCYYPSAEAFFAALDRIKHQQPLTAGQLTTNEPIAAPCTGCILVDGKWVPTAPPGFHRTRCLPVGSDQIVDCWVETQHGR